MKDAFDRAAERRRQENAKLLAMMHAGENLCHTDLGAFRWAPRPIIKKDEKAIKQLFEDKDE